MYRELDEGGKSLAGTWPSVAAGIYVFSIKSAKIGPGAMWYLIALGDKG